MRPLLPEDGRSALLVTARIQEYSQRPAVCHNRTASSASRVDKIARKAPMAASLDTFNAHPPRLFAIAYRMLGSRAAAEDVLQDAYVRWRHSDTSELRSTGGVAGHERHAAIGGVANGCSPLLRAEIRPLSIFGESRVRARGMAGEGAVAVTMTSGSVDTDQLGDLDAGS